MRTQTNPSHEAEKMLKHFDIRKLDILETRLYTHHIKTMSKAEALKVMIDTAEGDYSQLSPTLAEVAELMGPQG